MHSVVWRVDLFPTITADRHHYVHLLFYVCNLRRKLPGVVQKDCGGVIAQVAFMQFNEPFLYGSQGFELVLLNLLNLSNKRVITGFQRLMRSMPRFATISVSTSNY